MIEKSALTASLQRVVVSWAVHNNTGWLRLGELPEVASERLKIFAFSFDVTIVVAPGDLPWQLYRKWLTISVADNSTRHEMPASP